MVLTHWGLLTHICVSKLPTIGSDHGLSPGRRQAIIWTNDGILLLGPLESNFSEILIEIDTFSFKKMVDFLIGHYTYRIFPPAIDIIPTLLAVVYSNGKYTN